MLKLNHEKEKITTVKEFVDNIGWRISFEMFFSLVISHKKSCDGRNIKIIPLYKN